MKIFIYDKKYDDIINSAINNTTVVFKHKELDLYVDSLKQCIPLFEMTYTDYRIYVLEKGIKIAILY